MSALAQPMPIVMLDLSGGQIDGEHCTQIELNQWEHCQNAYGVGKKLRGRQGAKKVSTAGAYVNNLNSLRTYRPVAANWDRAISNIMVGTQAGFAYLSGTTLTVIDNSLPSSTKSWHMRQYKDVMYAVRQETLRSDSVLRRVTLAGASVAGIAAPATAPSAAEGAAGVITAGTYEHVVTFRNSVTGAESNPSPASSVTIAANKKIELTSVPVSASAQVDSRRIYRSLIDQSGIWYLVGTIANNTATTFSDNVDEDALGDAATTDNAQPVAGLHVLEEWNERLWAADEHNVYYSKILFPESWKATQLIPISPDDNQFINALLADGKGKRLLVGKSGSIHEITGVSNANFRVDLVSRNHGVAGSHCMTVAEGIVFFFSGENFYGINPGGRDPQSISTIAIRKVIDNIPAAQLENVRMGTFAPLNWMYAVVAQDTSTTHKKMLVYNYKTGAWSVFTFAAFGGDAPCFVTEAVGADGKIGLYAVVDGAANRFLYQFTDDVFTDGAGATDGHVIAVLARTKGFQSDGRLITLDNIGVLGRFVRNDPAAGPYNVGLYSFVEGVIYNITPKLLALMAPTDASKVGPTQAQSVAEWRRVNLSTAQNPGTFVQVELTCNEVENRVELAGLTLDLKVMARRRKVA